MPLVDCEFCAGSGWIEAAGGIRGGPCWCDEPLYDPKKGELVMPLEGSPEWLDRSQKRRAEHG